MSMGTLIRSLRGKSPSIPPDDLAREEGLPGDPKRLLPRELALPSRLLTRERLLREGEGDLFDSRDGLLGDSGPRLFLVVGEPGGLVPDGDKGKIENDRDVGDERDGEPFLEPCRDPPCREVCRDPPLERPVESGRPPCHGREVAPRAFRISTRSALPKELAACSEDCVSPMVEMVRPRFTFSFSLSASSNPSKVPPPPLLPPTVKLLMSTDDAFINPSRPPCSPPSPSPPSSEPSYSASAASSYSRSNPFCRAWAT